MRAGRPRLGLLDGLRGACLVSMILYHALYDLAYISGSFEAGWYRGMPGYIWQQSICWTFILLSGVCFRMSRNPLRHGIRLLLGGAAVTLVTLAVIPQELVQYGILTLLGLSSLLLIPLRKPLGKIRPGIGLAGSMLLFFLFRGVNEGYLGFEGLVILRLPEFLYSSSILAVLGFPGGGFHSSDYFSLIPWFFLYLAGYFLWALIGEREKVREFLTPQVPLLSFLGRHSLIIYLLHQPVLYAVLVLPAM